MPDRLNGSHQGWVPEARSEFGGIVDDDLAARRAHAVDASPLAIKRSRAGIETALPAAVVRPRSTAEVSRVVTWAAARSVPIVSWGAGSSVTGASLPAEDALVLDLRGLERILEIDAYGGRVVAEAGVLGGVLERELALQSLTTWMSPQSLGRSTVGGWVATRATGQFSSRWGGIEHAVASLTVVLADGRVGRLGTPPRGAVGPDLIQLFIGSEGAFGVVTEVGLRLYPLTRLERLGAYALSDVETGLEAIRRMMALGLRPAVVRLYDTAEALHLTLPEPEDGSVLLVAFAGAPQIVDAEATVATSELDTLDARPLGSSPTEAWLARRFDFSYVEDRLARQGGFAETIEVAADWRTMPSLYRDLAAALAPLAGEVLGHFSHAYTDGISLYLIVLGDAPDDNAAVERLETIWRTAMEIVIAHSAVISHHHGVGRIRGSWLPDQLGPAGFAVLERLKHALDPEGLLHPGSLGLTTAAREAV